MRPFPILAVALGLAASAHAAPLTVTPDRAVTLVSKDVGGKRWAISRDESTGTVSGNVFDPAGGDPQFVWCSQKDFAAGAYLYDCYGTGPCSALDCSQTWNLIGEVSLPISFFSTGPTPVPTPAPTPVPTAPPQGCPTDGPITDLGRDCSDYGYAYQQGGVIFALTSTGEVVAVCFASDPSQILCVGGPVDSPTRATLIGISLNDGPLLPLDSDGSLTIAGSSLRMGFAFGGVGLNVNASWFQTQRISEAGEGATVESDASDSLARLFQAARRAIDAASAPQSAGPDLPEALRSVGEALKR